MIAAATAFGLVLLALIFGPWLLPSKPVEATATATEAPSHAPGDAWRTLRRGLQLSVLATALYALNVGLLLALGARGPELGMGAIGLLGIAGVVLLAGDNVVRAWRGEPPWSPAIETNYSDPPEPGTAAILVGALAASAAVLAVVRRAGRAWRGKA